MHGYVYMHMCTWKESVLEREVQKFIFTWYRGVEEGRGREKEILIPKREYILELQRVHCATLKPEF